jgi:hypothetical protein
MGAPGRIVSQVLTPQPFEAVLNTPSDRDLVLDMEDYACDVAEKTEEIKNEGDDGG